MKQCVISHDFYMWESMVMSWGGGGGIKTQSYQHNLYCVKIMCFKTQNA